TPPSAHPRWDEYLQIQQRSDCRNGNRNVVYQKIVLQCVSVGVAVALDQAPVATGTDTSYLELRRARPLPRRADMTVRPARERIRERKPCLRARRRLFG